MRYLPLALLSPTLLVLIWLYWMFPRGSFPLGRRLYDVLVIAMTMAACVVTSIWIDESAGSSAVAAFGRPSGQIWSQVKPALCGYGASTLLLAVGVIVRGLVWRRNDVGPASR
jgi:hypothetical protein